MTSLRRRLGLGILRGTLAKAVTYGQETDSIWPRRATWMISWNPPQSF